MKRIINLEAAIDECRRNNTPFTYAMGKKHIKFYVNGAVRFILISLKNDNRDRVRRDIRKAVSSHANH